MRFYETILKPIPIFFLVVGLIIFNPLHVPPDIKASAVGVSEVAIVEEIKPKTIERDPEVAKGHAKNTMADFGWKSEDQWQCLELMWTKESNWRPNAYNKTPVYQNGKKLYAGGIPQILGLDPKITVERQIERGFSYIENRYSDPCTAWLFWQRNSYY
jgi:hypothetical protein